MLNNQSERSMPERPKSYVYDALGSGVALAWEKALLAFFWEGVG